MRICPLLERLERGKTYGNPCVPSAWDFLAVARGSGALLGSCGVGRGATAGEGGGFFVPSRSVGSENGLLWGKGC